jgi:signal recognition particle receptor subunit beta
VEHQPENRQEVRDPFAGWVVAARQLVADRDDLTARIHAAATRATRTSTVVAVVGEFKQGKSAFVNSLLSESLCPIDDHVATAVVTVVSHGPEPMVVVRRRDTDGTPSVERVDPGSRRALITEPDDATLSGGAPGGASGVANGADRPSIERIDIRVPNPLLERGLVVVDTPGVGGLRSAHALATRAFLPNADALVFVSDATSELTDTEVQFLADAVEICPTVVLALTKTDLFPQWRRIADLDRGHLERAGIEAPIFPVSFPLRVEAVRRGDVALDAESGYPELSSFLTDRVVPQVRAGAVRRAVDDIERALDSVAAADRTELAALSDPAAAQRSLDELSAAKERLAALASGGARWRTVLQDEVTDLTQEVTFRFRDRVRSALDTMDAAVDAADDQDALDAATDALRTSVVEAARQGFDEIEHGIDDVSARVADVLGLDELDVGTPEQIAEAARQVRAEWAERDDAGKEGSVAGDALTALRGAQGGILMLAVIGGLLPAAAATAVVAAPFMVGAGVLFGGKQLLDLRSQKRLRAKQKLKVTLRKSVDELQFRVGAELGDALRVAQRHLRDELGRRVDEIHRTTTESAQRLEAAIAGDDAQRSVRRTLLEARLARFDELHRSASTLRAARR